MSSTPGRSGFGQEDLPSACRRRALPCVAVNSCETPLQVHAAAGSGTSCAALTAAERRLVHAQLDRHYRQQLNERIPMLGDISPRQAAKTGKGRVKIASWLKFLENRTAQQDPDPMAAYDLTWLWQELGVGDLRK